MPMATTERPHAIRAPRGRLKPFHLFWWSVSVGRRIAQNIRAALRAALRVIWVIWAHARPESAFEKAIAVNSAVIVLETGAGYWITQHNPETYHYLIDTAFIALAALLGVVINFLLLRSSFRPLTRALEVVHAIEDGDLDARVPSSPTDADAQALATSFNGMLDQLERARDRAARQVMRAHEAERRQVALELHDQIGQSLTALALHAEALSRRLATGVVDPQAMARAARLSALAQDALREVQTLTRQLRPPLLDDAGLVPALAALAADARERLALNVRLDLRFASHCDPRETPEARLPAELETALYRIAQESLTNATRHGHAQKAWIRLQYTERAIRLLIMDDGQGFDPCAATFRPGLGLAGMRERAHLVGGTFRLRARPSAGCAMLIRVPITSASSSGQETFP